MSGRRNPGYPRWARASSKDSSPPPGSRPSGPPSGPDRSSGPRSRPDGGLSFLVQLAIVVGAFVVATALAELFGADSLGIAIGVGQVAFAIALVAVLLRGS